MESWGSEQTRKRRASPLAVRLGDPALQEGRLRCPWLCLSVCLEMPWTAVRLIACWGVDRLAGQPKPREAHGGETDGPSSGGPMGMHHTDRHSGGQFVHREN